MLLPGASYDFLVDTPSTQNPSFLRVKPDKPDESYLVIKVDNSVPEVSTLRVGVRMPLEAPPLSPSEIDTIRQWILKGAPRSAPNGGETDVKPPRFDGATLAVAVSSSEIDLFWAAALDEETPQEDIVYRVFVALATTGANGCSIVPHSVIGSTAPVRQSRRTRSYRSPDRAAITVRFPSAVNGY